MLIKLLTTSLGGLILAQIFYSAYKVHSQAKELRRMNPSLKIHTVYFSPPRLLVILGVSSEGAFI
jgi:hypothetical protein